MATDVKYLFLGGLFPKETEQDIINNSIGSVQNAANVLQWNIVEGLDKNLDEPVKILNSLYIGSCPKRYKKLFIPTYNFKHIKEADDINVGFCNLSGYKMLSRSINLNRELKNWIKNTPERKVVIAYAMTDVMINALYKAKQLDKDIVTCLIVPDLPQFMNTGSKPSIIYRLLKKLDSKYQKMKLSYIDKYVLLTDRMNDELKVKDYIVMEGIAVDCYENMENISGDEKTVFYAGGLNQKYGIKNLIDAFMKIEDPDYRLILCGAGDSEDYIREAQKKDSRIDFKGLLPRKEILSLQISSSVLINPRQNIEEFTKYSFPSKTIEYMLSARPVIMYKLDGVPDEYDNYLNYVPDNSVDSLKQKIVEICSLPVDERNRMGQAARKFVLNEKNSEKQVKKIIDLCGYSDN